MHLFYDRYTTRTRAELTLVVADMLTMVAATLYLAPALVGEAPTLDRILLIVWAATPRALARIISGLDQPTGSVKVLAAATISVLLVASLLGAGWDLIHSVSPPGYAPTPLALGMLLCAWGAGFLVCQPGAYRLFDFFLGGAILVGLKDGAPQPYIWIPVFFLAICLSGTVRHLLHDVFHDRRDPPINLQNARAVALLGAGVTTISFLVICLALGGGRFPEPAPRFDDFGRRGSPTRFSSRDGASRDRFREGTPWRGGAPADEFRPAVGGGQRGATGADEGGRRIGFTQHVMLRDLTRPTMDSAVVLRVRARPDIPAGRQWRPLETILWKGITLATYDVTTQGWKQPTMTEEARWPTTLPRAVPVGFEDRDSVTLVHVVVNPVFDNFITPYFTSEISTAGEDGDEDSGVLTYVRTSPGDDIFPRPGLRPYSSYITRTLLADTNDVPDAPLAPADNEVAVDPGYLEVPEAADLGVDVRAEARLIFDGTSGIRSKLAALKRHFEAFFEYSLDEDWRGGDAPLAQFLLRHRRGDCTYFATAAALLLRAADVPTRFVVGFAGGEWEPATGEVVVRNGRAHGWIEVHVGGVGWFPVDTTLWVAPREPAVVSNLAARVDALTGPAPESEEVAAGEESPSERSPRLAREDLTDAPTPESADEGPEIASSRPLEDGDITLPGVVRRLRSLVRTGQPDAALGDGAEEALDRADDERRVERSFSDWLSAAGAADPHRSGLSGSVRVAIRALFLFVSIVIVGMLIYVYVRPRGRKKGDETDALEVEDETFHLPAEAAAGPATSFDRSTRRGRVLAAYHHLQESLKATRNHRRPHQTPLEHARALGEQPRETEESFHRVHRALYQVLYGGREVSEDEVRSVERHCQRIRRALG